MLIFLGNVFPCLDKSEIDLEKVIVTGCGHSTYALRYNMVPLMMLFLSHKDWMKMYFQEMHLLGKKPDISLRRIN